MAAPAPDRCDLRRLPAGVTSFVGRESQVAEVTGLLKVSRLVTLTGPPGVGKTRLAIEVATRAASRYSDGVWPVDLAPVADPDGVAQAVASAISVREEPPRPLSETLFERLCHRRLLLVLDNCEHVVEECAQLSNELLRACPDLEMLATSREPLGIHGEQAWRVPPLAAPEPGIDDHPEVVAGYDAVRLFVDRATAVDPAFSLTAEVAPIVAEICRRLDGIPLAIELAAARVSVLTPAQILARLDDRLRLLTHGSRSALPRHRTLRAALDWSVDLLPQSERTLLRRLSVFRGGCTLEAAEHVCTGGEVAPERVLDLLGRLVAKSLVVADTGGAEARYRLLETVHHHGKEALCETGEERPLHRRHAAWCAELAERAEPELTGLHQRRWHERLDAEHDNLRAALRWAVPAGEAELALRLAGSLTMFWRVRGRPSEGVELLTDALSIGGEAPPRQRAKASWGAGLLASMLGDFATARSQGEESLALFSESGDDSGKARALGLLGVVLGSTGDAGGGLGLLEESVALARQAGDDWCLADALAALGRARIQQDEVASARACFQESLEVALGAEDHQGMRYALSGLGWAKLLEGDWDGAEWLLADALRLARELGEPYGAAAMLGVLGELELGKGDHERARSLLEEGLALSRAYGSPDAIAVNLCFLGRLVHDEGDPAGARALLEEALALALGAGERYSAARAREALGAVLYSLGDTAAAIEVLDEAMETARRNDDGRAAARALHELGRISRFEGDLERSARLHHEALTLQAVAGDLPGIAASLEALAGLAARQERSVFAARLSAAAQALRQAKGYARPATSRAGVEEDLGLVRAALSAEDFDRAWAQGAALPVADAVAYAGKGRGSRTREATGWGSLTKSEREVARLVAEGLTNREIGERLFVSHRTVDTHVRHILAKLGITSRRELAVEASRPGRADSEGPA